jgi:type II secretory pathway component PulJ
MKKITTSIFVPAMSRQETPLEKRLSLVARLQSMRSQISDDLGLGSLDDIKEEEEFELIVNGETEKHCIRFKGINRVGGKLRLMVQNNQSPEVHRFLDWRFSPCHIMTSNRGKTLQLKNFTTEDLRRLIRYAYANRERVLVNYR